MNPKPEHWKLASFFGWAGFLVGTLALFCNVVYAYVVNEVNPYSHAFTPQAMLAFFWTSWLFSRWDFAHVATAAKDLE